MTLDPEHCGTMVELRDQIDQIDRALVALLANRAAHIDRAIALKPAAGLPARIGARVDDVLSKVRREAVAQGLDPDLTTDLWTHLIDWSITREERVLGKPKENDA